ncbi:hypothetical protein [Streptomyces sp. CC210A]|uniref:hypothetical protein n=1 Tax=Streptomyces sp. CC210A TaxID=2898184 RepID=UPI001F3C11F2|nr:hypothetical protein [Streptomyces sp. CC210A]
MATTTIRHQTIRDAVALITGVLAAPEPLLDQQLEEVVSDLESADPLDVLATFASISVALTQHLADQTPHTPQELWQTYASTISTHLAEQENNR